MAGSTQTKNMQNALMSTLLNLLRSSLSPKTSKKAIQVLQGDKAQQELNQVISDNMPTVDTSTKTKKTKTKKDPDAPKRSCSSYIYFCIAKRGEIKENKPDLKGTEVTVELGRIWREDMDDDMKKEFRVEAENDKARYIEEMKEYSQSDSCESVTKTKKGTKKSTGSKGARSAYIFFCMDLRPTLKNDNDDMSAKEITAELGRMWREEYKDDEELNEKYITLANVDKKRYQDETHEEGVEKVQKPRKTKKDVDESDVEEKDTEEDDSDTAKKKKKNTKKTKKTKKEVDESDTEEKDTEEDDSDTTKKTKKKKKDVNDDFSESFSLFCKKYRVVVREENPKMSISGVVNTLKKMWSDMDDEEKSEY
jgi:hypothetical protein